MRIGAYGLEALGQAAHPCWMTADDDHAVSNDSRALCFVGGFLRVLMRTAPERITQGGQLLRIRFVLLDGGE